MTELFYNNKQVAKMEVHDSGDYVFFSFFTTDGKRYDTFNLRGEV